MRLAFIVSHPIQYYVPIYRGLAERVRQADERPKDEELKRPGSEGGLRQTDDRQLTTEDSARISALKVFYTWRDAGPAKDVKFGKEFAWDIPLMEGYDSEVVPNTSTDPGTHHRKGLINPDLVERVKAWKPDAVHITGYNYVSHGQAIEKLSKAGIPVIFRGDSHLLDGLGPWWKWWIKKSWLSKVYSCPQLFTYVGQNNRDYYRAFGVPEHRLFAVPHTIDVGRFAEPSEELETMALSWRRELGIPDDHFVFLYAAKLEPRKRPMELLEAFLAANTPQTTLLFVGSGELEEALKERVEQDQETKGLRDEESKRPKDQKTKGQPSPALRDETGRLGNQLDHKTAESANRNVVQIAEGKRVAQQPTDTGLQGEKTESRQLNAENSAHRVLFLPFQNQSRMPLVYRLGDALVLPSGYGETWGLAVNEAQACGRPSLVSDCVGCARDIVREGENGMIFRTDDWQDCSGKMKQMVDGEWRSKREAIRASAWEFDTVRGVEALLAVLASASKTIRPRDRRRGATATS